MHLKDIKILGFKSFADKTKVEFHKGITGIVGPNGCGKSNISDAFRWVLGEQSAKSMRGTKMHDIIFAGTTTRKPLNFAEVTLTLADVAGVLPTDFEEIAVTRRVHRSGESDYLINGKTVRLKDIHSLFMDSGIGKSSFSIFEQGKIDQVINYSPMERRYIFEEAAGILRFLQRKREALRKLEQTDANIERGKDIHGEVERQIIVLERQAEKARLYKDNRGNLEFLELALFVAKWDNLQKRIEGNKSKEQEKQRVIQETTETLQALEQELHEEKKKLTEGQLELQVRREGVYKKRSEKEIKSKEWQAKEERLQEIIGKEKQWLQELEEMMQKRKLRQIDGEVAQKQLEDVEKELKELELTRNEQRSVVKELEGAVSTIREQQQQIHQELVKVMRLENEIESELKQDTLRLEHNQGRKEQLIERRERLSEQVSEITHNQTAKAEVVAQYSQSVNEQKSSVESLDGEIKNASKQIDETKKNLDGVMRESAEARARSRVLLKIREQMEGFSVGSKKILSENSKQESSLFQKVKGLYESISPNKGSEKALAAALRPYTQTLIVENRADLESVISYAKENKLKDYSIVCLEGISANGRDVSGAQSLLGNVSENAIAKHFLNDVYVVKNSAEAFNLIQNAEGVEVWTEDGAYVDKRGVLFYSSAEENNIFIREAEIKELAQKITEKEAEQLSLEKVLDLIKQKKNELQERKVVLEKALRQDEMNLVEANFNLQRLKSDSSKILEEKEKMEGELGSLDEVSLSLREVITELKQKHTEAKVKAEEIKQQEINLTQEYQVQMETFSLKQGSLQEIEPAYQKTADEFRKLTHQLNLIEVKNLETERQEKRLQQEIERIHEQQKEIRDGGSEYQEAILEVEKKLADAIESTSEFEKEVNKWAERIEIIDSKLNETRNFLREVENQLHHLGIQSAQFNSSNQSLVTELEERYHKTIQALKEKEYELKKPIDQAEREVRALRRKIDDAGDINMTSIEEFDKHKERYEFLGQQIDDLESSKKELVEIITQLDEESRKIFKDTFAVIRENFRKNFQILFNGGEADLQFTETEDVLEAGIEIVAKPPGKQMRSISLMSGGEKCLTALALLFAIFEVKPAPFCILDEIDAPLDDANVERFLNVVKQFIDRCQFIIITHNKRTMAIADVLFGVSMQEKGVSKLLSLEFEKENAPEPILV